MKTSLIELSRFREAPRDVVRNCRALTPTAELVYMDEGAWYLGSVERTTIRERAGAHKRAVASRIWKKMDTLRVVDPQKAYTATWMWWEGTLLMQGFAGIEIFRGDPDSRVEEFLRKRHYGWARDLDASIRRQWAEDDQASRHDGDEAVSAAEAYSTYFDDRKLREAYRWAFRTPKSFTSKYQGAA